MANYNEHDLEDATPNPEFLIKSIAEQGYSLETAIADLIDNSISAKADKTEVLLDTKTKPFTLYIADNGVGMDEKTLRAALQFPSSSPDHNRDPSDLGRFGLGMKTASFSQTRCFTVISKKKGSEFYSGRTWDVDFLKENKWRMIVNSNVEINDLVSEYSALSKAHLNSFENFEANTIIIWKGLFKYENYIEDKNRKDVLSRELSKVANEHLSLVFHRFMERKNLPLQIRLNNHLVKPYNPFPIGEDGFRAIEDKHRTFGNDSIKIEGFVLPSRSIDEVKNGLTQWTTPSKGLMDMEGIYIYRSDRIILFGGWNGLIKKSQRLQLARLRVEIGNNADHLLHLNIAKSQVIIPHDLRNAFEAYVNELKVEAEREFYNKSIHKFTGSRTEDNERLFKKVPTSRGMRLEVNKDFPLLQLLINDIPPSQKVNLSLFIRMINTILNKIRQTHENDDFASIKAEDCASPSELHSVINSLISNGMSPKFIKNNVIPDLGITPDTLPTDIQNLLKEQ
jgi:hypothetical protein